MTNENGRGAELLTTYRLEKIVRKEIGEKFPENDLRSDFKFFKCHKNDPPGIYIYNNGDIYVISYIDERGNIETGLETRDFDELFYEILENQFLYMYFYGEKEFKIPKPKFLWRLRGRICNLWPIRNIRHFIRKSKDKGKPDSRIEWFNKQLEWYGLFGEYYYQRWKKEMDALLSK